MNPIWSTRGLGLATLREEGLPAVVLHPLLQPLERRRMVIPAANGVGDIVGAADGTAPPCKAQKGKYRKISKTYIE